MCLPLETWSACKGWLHTRINIEAIVRSLGAQMPQQKHQYKITRHNVEQWFYLSL